MFAIQHVHMATENTVAVTSQTDLSSREKMWAGILLVLGICLPIFVIVLILNLRVEKTALSSAQLVALVACAGFLGNAIHIANSLTAYIGSGNFLRSWRLWYFVTPFTGAALALILFFAFGSGLMKDDPTKTAEYVQGIYSVLAISALAGMFTDITTMKLKEIFVAILNPKDERAGKLDPQAARPSKDNTAKGTFKITGVDVQKLNPGPNTITLSGQALTSKKVTVKINDQVISDPKIADTSIIFDYTVPDGANSPFKLTVNDDSGRSVYETQLAA